MSLKITANTHAALLTATVLGIATMFSHSIYCITPALELLDRNLKQLSALLQSQPTYPWPALFLQTELVTNRKGMQTLYNDDCMKLSNTNGLAVQRPKASKFRVATFNVFAFRGVLNTQSATNIRADIIEKIVALVNPDVIVFEEIGYMSNFISSIPFGSYLFTPELFKLLEKIGYAPPSSGWKAAITNLNVPSPCMICVKKGFNATFSSTTYQTNSGDWRGYVRAEITPSTSISRSKKIIVYGTHLDITNETEETRQAQIEELLKRATQDVTSENVVIVAGDLNSVNLADYADNKPMLERLVLQRTAYLKETRRAPLTCASPPQKVFDAIKKAGFVDVFSFAQSPPPRWTVWTGSRVDWILLPASTKNITVHPGVYYPVVDGNVLSDHILVFADFEFQ